MALVFDEIRRAIATTLHQSPRCLINTHWHFDHTDGNPEFAEDGTTVVAHANCGARLSQDQFIPSVEWRVRSSPRSAWPVLTFNAPVSVDLGSQTLELMPQEPVRDALLSFHNMLSTIEVRMQRLIAASRPVPEMLAAAPTADFDPVWGRGYVTGGIFLRMILAGLGLTAKAITGTG